MKHKKSKSTPPKYAKKLEELNKILGSSNISDVEEWLTELDAFMRRMCIPELDKFTSDALASMCDVADSVKEGIPSKIRFRIMSNAERYAMVFQYFHAVFSPNQSVDKYIKDYDQVTSDGRMSVEGCNSLLFDYGMAALPDVIRSGYHSSDTKVADLLQRNLRSIWNFTSYEVCCSASDNMAKPVFESINMSILKQAMLPLGISLPECITEAKDIDMKSALESDIKILKESFEGDVLIEKLQQYNEKYVDVSGAYHIMMNLFQEGAYSVDSYVWVKDKFESIGERCERENNYLLMCEASYRATGKIPRYIDRTYDFGDGKGPDNKDEKKDDWINPPSKDDDLPEPAKSSKKDLDDVDDDKPTKKGAGNIYNITYNNSFNKRSKQRNIHGSYNTKHTNSHNVTDDHSNGGKTEDEIKTLKEQWEERRKEQLKLSKTYEKHRALSAQPEDLDEKYLDSLGWTTENLRKAKPWDIMRDTQTKRPQNDIAYRKYLAKQIIDLADDRDIEFDGKIIVAGDAVDGIYEIELNRYNDAHIMAALRKCANAVIDNEIKELSAPKKVDTGNKTLNEALNLFDDMKSLMEKVEGGDPLKDRKPIERVQNRLHDFNVKAQGGLQKVDSGLRDGKGTLDLAAQTPVQLVRTIKNFISDQKDRNQQDIKEDLLKGNTSKRFILDMMSSLIKTALPWVIAGPLWGTLFNMIALPIRGFKGVHNMVRGGPHWKYKIELREELRTHIQILDRKIENARTDNDRKEEQRLMRVKNTMVQEFVKIAGGIGYDATGKFIDRSKVSD